VFEFALHDITKIRFLYVSECALYDIIKMRAGICLNVLYMILIWWETVFV